MDRISEDEGKFTGVTRAAAIRGQKVAPSSGGNDAPTATKGKPARALMSAVESVSTPSAVLPGQVLTQDRLEPSRKVASANGFRHLRLSAGKESRLVFQTDPNGIAAEQFRLLCRNLRQEFDAGAVLVITSPGMGDGKTLTAANLCMCLAGTGNPTLLIEMDFRRPKAGETLGCRSEPPGLEDALAGKVEPGDAVLWIKELNIHAAMVAKTPENPSRLLCGAGIEQFVKWARDRFVWVVLDAAPVLPAADVLELLPLADAALLVVRAHRTPLELLKRAIEMLGKQLRGVIFNEVTIDSNPHYRYVSDYTNGLSAKSSQSVSETRSKKS